MFSGVALRIHPTNNSWIRKRAGISLQPTKLEEHAVALMMQVDEIHQPNLQRFKAIFTQLFMRNALHIALHRFPNHFAWLFGEFVTLSSTAVLRSCVSVLCTVLPIR